MSNNNALIDDIASANYVQAPRSNRTYPRYINYNTENTARRVAESAIGLRASAPTFTPSTATATESSTQPATNIRSRNTRVPSRRDRRHRRHRRNTRRMNRK